MSSSCMPTAKKGAWHLTDDAGGSKPIAKAALCSRNLAGAWGVVGGVPGKLSPGWSYSGVEQFGGSCVSGVSAEMTYPLLRTVCSRRGWAASISSLWRNRWM